MEQKDFSHFKYYANRLKEMGFVIRIYDDAHVYFDLRSYKNTGRCDYYVSITDYPAYDFNKDDFPRIRLHFFRLVHGRYVCFARTYKIGCKKSFPECIKKIGESLAETINEYPTLRSAFNQLVADYHELEKNARKRIHKGVSIHET